jgi:octaprenyl-diphosphate synthase
VDQYQGYLKHEMELVQGHLEEAFTPNGQLMSEVASYVLSLRGKMLRPAFVCLTAKAFGYDHADQHHARLGAALEIFHVATLLHDDVIDGASLRRGRPTVNDRWGNDVAILFADYLYAVSFDLALAVLRPEVVQVLTKTTRHMTEGEMFQIEKRGEWLAVADYLTIIRSKTAHLFSACSGLGAMIANASSEDVRKMFEFGLQFGMAFQITDDALDYEAQGDGWGKRVGADLKEGKQTLPLLYTLEQASEADRATLVHTLNNGRDFETVHGLVKRYNAIDYSLERAAEYTRAALEILDSFEDNDSFHVLRRLCDGVLVRQT